MTSDQLDSETAARSLTQFLEGRLKTSVAPDLDLFASGLVASMFAMELVVHLEQSFGVTIVGSNLKMDNFRSVNSMVALVTLLRTPSDAVSGA